jgi:DNA-binding response OmpR family regulator
MPSGCQILLVDPNGESARTFVQALAIEEGITITQVAAARQGLALLRRNRFDAIIVHFNLPDMEAWEFCEAARRQRILAPILVVDGDSSNADAIIALNAGATDYIVKPFRASVLRARLRAHLRRFRRSGHATVSIGHFIFEPGPGMLLDECSKQRTKLSNKEAALLQYMCQAGDRVVPRNELLREVWGQESGVSSRTVETHIYKLRRKIESDPRKPKVLLTWRSGYRLKLRSDTARTPNSHEEH